MKKSITLRALLGGATLGLGGFGWYGLAAETGAEACQPSGELKFLCGIKNPEDLLPLPGNHWIVVSGMAPKSGLHLIDSRTKNWERWIAPAGAAPRAPYDKCTVQPSPDDLAIHGVALRNRGARQLTLYAVNHGGKEAGQVGERIEVFDIDMTKMKPTLSWAGCLPWSPQLAANSVVAGPNGSVFATVMVHPSTPEERANRQGAVYKWTPGAPSFERIAGADLRGNNGIEISPDGKTLYVTSRDGLTEESGAVSSFTNTNPAKLLSRVVVQGGFADNLHWVDGRLILAGPRTDLCSSKDNAQQPGIMAMGTMCMASYHSYIVNPKTLALTSLAKGPVHPNFTGGSAALPMGRTLWIGSFNSDRLAYRTLP